MSATTPQWAENTPEWARGLPQPKSTPGQIDPAEVAELIRTKTPGVDFVVVDLRRHDWEVGPQPKIASTAADTHTERVHSHRDQSPRTITPPISSFPASAIVQNSTGHFSLPIVQHHIAWREGSVLVPRRARRCWYQVQRGEGSHWGDKGMDCAVRRGRRSYSNAGEYFKVVYAADL